MIRFCKQLFSVLFAFYTCSLSAQNTEASFKLLKSELQNKKAENFPFTNWNQLSAAIEEVKGDTTSTKSFDYLTSLYETAIVSEKAAVRQFSVEVLVTSLGRNGALTNKSIVRLQQFRRIDFSEMAKYELKRKLNDVTNNIGELAKLTAFVCGKDCRENLQNLLVIETIGKRDKKDIRLALIRTGQATYEQKLVKAARAQVVNDDFVYNLVNDLIYTRSKLVFDYLLEVINSDEKRCTSANNDNPEPMICAYRLMEKVAPCIVNFPAKVNAYGELDTKDYKKLLSDVRAWISKNKDKYQISFETY